MELQEALFTRRSVRRYDPERQVPRQQVEQLLQAAVMAPSGINLQPWYFVALQSEEKMAELRGVMGATAEKFLPVLQARFAKNPEVVKETTSFLTSLGGAPTCILVFLLKPDYPDPTGALESTSAAIENLLLCAHDMGLGTCWMSAPLRVGSAGELERRFAPTRGQFVAMITLGYGVETPKAPVRRDGRWEIL